MALAAAAFRTAPRPVTSAGQYSLELRCLRHPTAVSTPVPVLTRDKEDPTTSLETARRQQGQEEQQEQQASSVMVSLRSLAAKI